MHVGERIEHSVEVGDSRVLTELGYRDLTRSIVVMFPDR
jgi:hypothetical protein